MKDAKNYKHDDGNGVTTITSFAHFLTVEGLNVMTASLVRDAIETSTDDEFKEDFDDSSKDEAREFLDAYELSVMPYWGADELAKAIHDSDQGRDEKLALRAITLAQKVGEIPDVFTPKQGVEWAMDRGYLIRYYAGFVCAAPGIGHPHNLLSDGPHHKQKSRAQNTATPAPAENVGVRNISVDWKNSVRAEAYEEWVTQIASNGTATLEAVATHLANWCKINNVNGNLGKPPTAGYLKTHVICAQYWKPPRSMTREAAKKHLEQKKQEKQSD